MRNELFIVEESHEQMLCAFCHFTPPPAVVTGSQGADSGYGHTTGPTVAAAAASAAVRQTAGRR